MFSEEKLSQENAQSVVIKSLYSLFIKIVY